MNGITKIFTNTKGMLPVSVLLLMLGKIAVGNAQDLNARDIAPSDFTGIWVSVITEDWRHRMMTPPIGDTASLPINAEGQRVAEAWNPQADMEAGMACRAYGAAGIMRMPTRLRVSWQDENTMSIETDAGEQTRLLHFPGDSTPMSEASWQGYSRAHWEGKSEGQGEAAALPGEGELSGSLAVTTSNLRPGYLRRNGVPYSANTVVEEHFDVFDGPNGDRWLVVLTKVVDPVYLEEPMWTSTHFKQESSDANWSPSPCRITLPTRSSAVSVD